MATLTKAEIADRVLEHLGVKSATQTASAEDTRAAEEAFDSAYARLRFEGKAPFTTAAIPEWAWTPLRDFIARDLVDTFGISGERLASILGGALRAEKDFSAQTGRHDPRVVVKPRWF